MFAELMIFAVLLTAYFIMKIIDKKTKKIKPITKEDYYKEINKWRKFET